MCSPTPSLTSSTVNARTAAEQDYYDHERVPFTTPVYIPSLS